MPGKSKEYQSSAQEGKFRHKVRPIDEESVEEASIGYTEVTEALTSSVNSINTVSDKLMIKIKVNGQVQNFQVGSDVYKQLQSPPHIPTKKVLKSYGGTLLPLIGTIDVDVELADQKQNLPL